MNHDLQGQAAIVTGAAMGIGKACAAALAGAGASVVLADVDAVAGEAATDEVTAVGGQAIFIATDVTRMVDMQAMAAAVARFGAIELLVSNAARAIGGKVDEIDEDSSTTVLSTYLTSVWRGMRVCVPEMKKRGGGAIVTMSLVRALTGFSGWVVYAAAKGGINAPT